MESEVEVDLSLLGLEQQLEIGLSLQIPRTDFLLATRGLASIMDETPDIPFRIAGISADNTHVELIIAVTQGSLNEIKVAGPTAIKAVRVLHRLVNNLSNFTPTLVQLPAADSISAATARRFITGDPQEIARDILVPA